MRIAVTGGAGFIGSHAVDRLVERGDETLVIDDLSTGRRANVNPAARFVQLDIASPEVSDLLDDFRPDAVVHFAAQASVIVSMEQPERDARINIIGGLNLWRGAVAGGAAQFLYINTGGALYGTPDYLPIGEDHPIRPMSAYGLSKATLESYLRIFATGSPVLKVLRLANIYGPRQEPEGEAGVVSIFGLRMHRDEPVTIFGDGEQTRDFVYVGDVVRAMELSLAQPEPHIVNIGSGDARTVNDVFRAMAAETDYSRPPVHAPERAGEIRHVTLNADLARAVLDWVPQTTFSDGIRATAKWLGTQTRRS